MEYAVSHMKMPHEWDGTIGVIILKFLDSIEASSCRMSCLSSITLVSFCVSMGITGESPAWLLCKGILRMCSRKLSWQAVDKHQTPRQQCKASEDVFKETQLTSTKPLVNSVMVHSEFIELHQATSLYASLLRMLCTVRLISHSVRKSLASSICHQMQFNELWMHHKAASTEDVFKET